MFSNNGGDQNCEDLSFNALLFDNYRQVIIKFKPFFLYKDYTFFCSKAQFQRNFLSNITSYISNAFIFVKLKYNAGGT